MKILVCVLTALLLLLQCRAQNEFQICAENKNEIIRRLLINGRLDSSDQEKYLMLDEDWKNCIRGRIMPSFNIDALDGKEINSDSLSGKILVVNFWFIACPPCIAEIPAFNRLASEYRDRNVLFLGFTNDSKKMLRKKFLPKNHFDVTVVPEADDIEDLFGVLNHPSTFVIGRDGKAVAAWEGGSTGEKANAEAYQKIKPVLDRLLKQGAEGKQ